MLMNIKVSFMGTFYCIRGMHDLGHALFLSPIHSLSSCITCFLCQNKTLINSFANHIGFLSFFFKHYAELDSLLCGDGNPYIIQQQLPQQQLAQQQLLSQQRSPQQQSLINPYPPPGWTAITSTAIASTATASTVIISTVITSTAIVSTAIASTAIVNWSLIYWCSPSLVSKYVPYWIHYVCTQVKWI